MKKLLRYPLQIFNYVVFMVLVWYFSLYPSYQHLEEDQAMITFTLGHVGKYVRPCIKYSQEELMKLPPNMRKPMDCPRERSPISMELMLDGDVVFRKVSPPLGLYKDQGIDIYENIKAPAGRHMLTVWLNDDINIEGPVYKHEQEITLAPQQHLIVEFKSEKGGFNVF